MEFEGMTSDTGSVDTPWGTVETMTRPAIRGMDGQCTSPFQVDTAMGKARASLHVEIDRDELPTRLRIVVLCGYDAMATTKEMVERESLLSLAGAFVGWRAQAYLDPATGLPDPDKPTSVMLADHAGKLIQGFPVTQGIVVNEVDASLGAAADADPGYVARVYASLMRRLMRDIEDDVTYAENPMHGEGGSAEEARDVRDRARALLAAAEEVEGRGIGPTP